MAVSHALFINSNPFNVIKMISHMENENVNDKIYNNSTII